MTGASSVEAVSWSMFTSSTTSLTVSRPSASSAGLLLGILDDVFHRAGLGALDMMKLVDDRLLGGDQRHDLELGDAPDVVDGEDVQRIGHREEQAVLQARNGADFVIG